jgi:hypothetical protein
MYDTRLGRISPRLLKQAGLYSPVVAIFALFILLAAGPAVLAAGPSCSLPGVTVMRDQTGDATDTLPAHDIQSFAIAEPANLTGQSVYTIKVADLSLLPPNTEWIVDWRNYYGMTSYFITMNTFDATRGPVFTYGHYDCSVSLCQSVTDGEADAGEYLPDGTIRLTIANSKLGNQPGQIIGSYQGAVRLLHHPTFGLGGDFDNMYGASSDYTFVGNAACNVGGLPTAAPTNLTAISPNNNGAKKSLVTLVWDDNADNEQVYHIERSTTPYYSGFVELGTVGANSTSYEDRSVQGGTTYYYRVRASNPGGYSAYSNTASAYVK